MIKIALDDFFHGFSKVVIFIPILIVGMVLLIKYWPKQPIVIQNVPVMVGETALTSSADFNLSGPLVCLTGKNAMYIKNQQVKVILAEGNSQAHYLLNGDCLYKWQKGTLHGQKICGLGIYLTVFGKLPLNGILDSQLLSVLKNKIDDKTKDSIIKLLDACKDKSIDNMDLFNIPKQVLFKEGELP